MGAFIVILLLGVSTFTQNVITQVVKPFPLGANTGQVPISTNYTWFDQATTLGLGDQQPLPQMIASIQGGFYSFATGQSSASLSEYSWCDGDTCDFGKYQSLAVCGQCADMSSAVHNPCPTGNCTNDDFYVLSNGVDLSLNATNGILNMTSDTNYTVSPELSSVVGPLIVRFHAMVANQSESNVTGLGASAMECAAWWCVRSYGGKMVNGTLSEQVFDDWTDTSAAAKTSYLQEDDITLQPPTCVANNTKPTNQSYCAFNAGAYTQAALQNFLTGGNFTTSAPFLTGSTVYSGFKESTTYNYTSLLAGALTSYSIAKNDIITRVREGFETMAHEMTVSVREEETNVYTWEYTYGNATIQEQKFHVRWGWLGYPVSLVVLSVIFLIVTIILSRNDEIWKTSVLAMMFHAFSDEDRRQLGALNTAEEMETIIRDRKVMLGKEDATGHLLFKAGSSAPPRHGSGYDLGDKAARLGAHGSQAGFNVLDDGNISVP